jgi:hypothetical protein
VRERYPAHTANTTRRVGEVFGFESQVSGGSTGWRSKCEHAQNPIRRDGGCDVLQGVAADDAAQIENGAVCGFKHFCERVDEQGDDEEPRV